jgi:hypothetical protein
MANRSSERFGGTGSTVMRARSEVPVAPEEGSGTDEMDVSPVASAQREVQGVGGSMVRAMPSSGECRAPQRHSLTVRVCLFMPTSSG